MGIPLLSIIMPVLNEDSYLEEALESILSQSLQDFELIIVDDGASKGAGLVLDRAVAEHPNITLLRKPVAEGLTKALVHGLQLARGKYIGRQDANDCSLPGRFERQVSVLEKDLQYGAVLCGYHAINEVGAVIGEEFRACHPLYLRWELLFGDYMGVGGQLVFRRSILKKVGGYDVNVQYVPDLDLLSRISQHSEILILEDCLYSSRNFKNCLNSHSQDGRKENIIGVVRDNLRRFLQDDMTFEAARTIHLFWSSPTNHSDLFQQVKPLLLRVKELFFERFRQELSRAPEVRDLIEQAVASKLKKEQPAFNPDKSHSRLNSGEVGVIFAHHRSGSTALFQIIRKINNELRMFSEPFNVKSFQEKDPELYDKRLKVSEDPLYCDEFLNHLENNYDLYKHLFNQTGFSQNQRMILRPNTRIVFLTRKNLLQTLVSLYLANENKIWCQPLTEEPLSLRERIGSYRYDPIDIDELSARLIKYHQQIRSYKEILRENNREFYEVYYEDLFAADVSLEKKLAEIDQICRFLKIEKDVDQEGKKDIERFLDADLRKINCRETYLLIPNIMEVEEKLGNRETGFLFKTCNSDGQLDTLLHSC